MNHVEKVTDKRNRKAEVLLSINYPKTIERLTNIAEKYGSVKKINILGGWNQAEIRFETEEAAFKMVSDLNGKEIILETPMEARQEVWEHTLRIPYAENMPKENLDQVKEFFEPDGCLYVIKKREGILVCFNSQEQRDTAFEKYGSETVEIGEVEAKLKKGLFPRKRKKPPVNKWKRKREKKETPVKEDLDRELDEYLNSKHLKS